MVKLNWFNNDEFPKKTDEAQNGDSWVQIQVNDLLNDKSMFYLRNLLANFINQKKSEEQGFDRKAAEVFNDVNLFRDFENFCLQQFINWEFKFDSKKPINFVEKIREKYNFQISNDIYLYEAIRKHCSYEKKNVEHRSRMLRFNAVYHILENLYLSKDLEKNDWTYEKKFENIIRNVFLKLNSWEKYFFEQFLSFMLLPALKDFPDFDRNIIWSFFEKTFSY